MRIAYFRKIKFDNSDEKGLEIKLTLLARILGKKVIISNELIKQIEKNE